MRIDEVDARTAPDEVLLAFHRIEETCRPELAPGEPGRSETDAIAFYRHQPTTHTSCHWLAGGGFAALYVHSPAAAFAHIKVLPDRRRAGIGAALLESVLQRCRELGVVALHAEHATSAGAAFAARRGARDGQRIVKSMLDLRRAALEAPQLSAGWELATWLRRVPDEHLDAFVVARRSMDDAPAPDEFDFPSATAERVRASEDSLAQRNREMRVTVAIRDDGEIGAFTELRLSKGSTSGFTDDTGTVAAHRGQGLARAVKVESLRKLRADHPEVEVVTTSNAEENAAMLHINRSVGFRPTVTVTTATLTL
ncbi:GNAT family N-acetyltransferase [Gaiella sp.]|uniref:GNAT family N-acetyltransferase n=1 Tax=Gaiella sp. TaxID=2663207 RepID=UPI002E348759|nr:GNAT family N-acetyltransferase [Gaiella sp.]HEX5582700.1 GNAT family N-acetyltransferase [Gaiella sp.]